ncbi:MAG: cytochrome c oxidase accessory protein FixG [Bacteroidetes bacterium]|nr:MAG: cytochrome c oxidase accessory protein FixG [Bacteroidota bacterium]
METVKEHTEKEAGENKEIFRDSVSTIDERGKRVWLYPKQPKGKLYNARTIASFFYLAVFFTLPFIKINGHPLFLFNVIERKFIFFGVVFWPQDFHLFLVGMLTFIVFIIVFTVAYGRLFCGWACPQTVFMEMVFRRIEYLVEGDAKQQRMLNSQRANNKKLAKKIIKHSIFFLISFIIANAFLSYIIGADQLFHIMKEPVKAHLGGFISLLAFTGVFYGVFAWFREQACLIVCPYGRMQGVLLDKNSIVVAYDYKRGEPRGHLKKEPAKKHGDCVDCSLCVHVCPTGIDIRNGTQLECVNCTACIDACDAVMDKVKKPRGLIRYASENDIAEGRRLRISTRKIAYGIVLVLLTGFLAFLLVTREDVETTVLRAPGLLFNRETDGRISNVYKVKVINKTYKGIPIRFVLENKQGEIKMIGNDMLVKPEGLAEGQFFIYLPVSQIDKRKTEVEIGVYAGDEKIETITTTFMGPVTPKKQTK